MDSFQRGRMSVFEGSRRQQGGMVVFEGSRRQRGGNLFSTIKRVLIPLGKSIAPVLKSTGKDLTNRGVRVGVAALKDKLAGQNMGKALRTRASHAVDRALTDYLGDNGPDIAFTSQDGDGLRRKRKRATSSKRAPKRRRKSVKRKKSTKRLRSTTINKVKKQARKIKRRRRKRKIKLQDIFS